MKALAIKSEKIGEEGEPKLLGEINCITFFYG